MKKKTQICATVIMLVVGMNIIACTKKAEQPATSPQTQSQGSLYSKTNTKNPPGYAGSSTLGDSTKAVK